MKKPIQEAVRPTAKGTPGVTQGAHGDTWSTGSARCACGTCRTPARGNPVRTQRVVTGWRQRVCKQAMVAWLWFGPARREYSGLTCWSLRALSTCHAKPHPSRLSTTQEASLVQHKRQELVAIQRQELVAIRKELVARGQLLPPVQLQLPPPRRNPTCMTSSRALAAQLRLSCAAAVASRTIRTGHTHRKKVTTPIIVIAARIERTLVAFVPLEARVAFRAIRARRA